MRDHRWLTEQLQYLLSKYFADVAITNPIEIKFGREAKYRFGSIRLERKRTFPFKKREALFGTATIIRYN